ncbi:protein of unknown function [Paraburkholderia kururiensis]|uniref:hypothetical protein n=1 Tax=Paraburkholderia kururiensis TaxID=984307 RepID=UPI0039A768AC
MIRHLCDRLVTGQVVLMVFSSARIGAAMANHAWTRTTQFCDRWRSVITLAKVEPSACRQRH